jgi:tetratricopeptide (TPR) repeat protein
MVTSPLEHEELRHIERNLDAGNTAEAAQLLARFANSRDHEVAITFLATRLLFQRGRIDTDGAADRINALLEHAGPFPEAEEWLTELEGRTEPSAVPKDALAAEASSPKAAEEKTSPSHSPPSHAPSVPRGPSMPHPYLDELVADEDDEEVTPAEPAVERRAAAERRAAEERREAVEAELREAAERTAEPVWPPPRNPDSSEPPPRPPTDTSLAPATSESSRSSQRAPPYRAHKPFDSMRAKEQLSAHAGRYRASSYPDELREPVGPSRNEVAPPAGSAGEVRNAILAAWELVLGGRWDEARALIPEEPTPPGLDAETRVALARVLLEVGDAERAAAEAVQALDEAPALAEARLMFIWCAVRHARQRDDAWCLERARQLLEKSILGPPPEGGLVLALTACVEARIGTPAVALRLAQRALRANAESTDGLAALAEAAALCGEEPRAEAALERLFTLSEAAAEQITPRLRRLGVGEQGPTSSASLWMPLEHTLSSGARDIALEGLEALARDKLPDLELLRPDAREDAARAVSHFLTLAPIFRHFGSYDLSLPSLDRLEAALGLLYGVGPRPLDVQGASSTLWRLAGVYLGETLRRVAGGRWRGNDPLESAKLEVLGRDVLPFQIVRHRIAHGRHATLADALENVLATLASSSSAGRQASWEGAREVFPPLPWDRDWPTLEDLPRLGRALGHSVVAVYCASHGTSALDRSSKTLPALDRYIELLAPAHAPLAPSSVWARWLAGFLGGYLGEVLCKEFGGVWVRGDGQGREAAAIQVAGRRLSPVALVHETLTGGSRISLENYAGELRKTVLHPDSSGA